MARAARATSRSRSCRSCDFFSPGKGNPAFGECRRWPPRWGRTWPETRVDEWCGEWVDGGTESVEAGFAGRSELPAPRSSGVVE